MPSEKQKIAALAAENKRLREALEDLVYQAKRVCGNCEQWLSLDQAVDALRGGEGKG